MLINGDMLDYSDSETYYILNHLKMEIVVC